MTAATLDGAPSKYREIARLGSGAVTDVTLAQVQGPAGFNKLVVIKRLRRAGTVPEAWLERFSEEAQLAARLNHPNIVNTFEVGEDAMGLFIATEFLEGQSLDDILESDDADGFRLPLRLRVLIDVLGALHYAHELEDYDRTPLGMAHRALSPNKVFVLYTGETKLVDFGMAQDHFPSTDTTTARRRAAYVAPECSRGTIDRRVDVFATGVMLWEALTRRRLWDNESSLFVQQLALTGTLSPPQAVDPMVHPALATVCLKAIAPDVEDRYRTAGEFQEALESAVAAAGLESSSREVGRFLERQFGHVHTRVREQINASIKRSHRPASLPKIRVGSLPPPGDELGPPMGDAASPDGPVGGSLAVRRMSPWVAAAVVVLVPAAAAAGYLAVAPSRSKPATEHPATASMPPASVAAPSIGSAAEAPNPAARTVKVEIAATPADAVVKLDGRPVKNPFRTTVPAEGRPHTIEVSAFGFAPEKRTITYDTDIVTDIALTPNPVVLMGPMPAAPAPPPRVEPPPSPPAPPPEEPPQAAPTNTVPAMGDTMQVRPKEPSVAIDTANPWGN